MHVATLPLDRIAIRGRARREMRNIDSLAKSICDRGLLQPVVVRPDGDGYALVAGGRRIEALRQLGEVEVPAHVAESLTDELEALLAEGEENTEREPFTPTEAVEHAERIRGVEEQRAAERKRAGQAAGRAERARARTEGSGVQALAFLAPEPTLVGGKFPPTSDAPKAVAAKTRDQVAKATGMSGRTLEKARRVVEAAKDPEAPAVVRQAAREAQVAMDRTGKVDPAFKKVREAEEAVSAGPVNDYLEQSGAADDIRRARWRANFRGELAKTFGLLGKFRPEQVAASIDDDLLDELRRAHASFTEYMTEIEALRGRPAGLSLIVGG